MAHIDLLPLEILCMIFDEVDASEKSMDNINKETPGPPPFRGLLACVFVCKAWTTPARAAFYSHFPIISVLEDIPLRRSLISLRSICRILDKGLSLPEFIFNLYLVVENAYNDEGSFGVSTDSPALIAEIDRWKKTLEGLRNIRRVELTVEDYDTDCSLLYLSALDASPASKDGKISHLTFETSDLDMVKYLSPAFSFYSTLESLSLSTNMERLEWRTDRNPEDVFHSPSFTNLNHLSLVGFGIDDDLLEGMFLPLNNPLRERLSQSEILQSRITSACACEVLPDLKIFAFTGDDLDYRDNGEQPEKHLYPYDMIVPRLYQIKSLDLMGVGLTGKLFNLFPQGLVSLSLNNCGHICRQDFFRLLETDDVAPNLGKLEVVIEDHARHESWDKYLWVEEAGTRFFQERGYIPSSPPSIPDSSDGGGTTSTSLERPTTSSNPVGSGNDRPSTTTTSGGSRVRPFNPLDYKFHELLEFSSAAMERALLNGPRASKLAFHKFSLRDSQAPYFDSSSNFHTVPMPDVLDDSGSEDEW